jgi:hypothetical protein
MAKTADGPKVAIVGITGAVGQEFLRVRIGSGPAHSGPMRAPLDFSQAATPQGPGRRQQPHASAHWR